ncbi:hypothetical protein [Helicobacter bizzozeronii]|uniref:hypothetical protein n=1 Tax=Helicobacter bizzozeronii TaxID=56877 RepID=UPI000CEE155D|nr:hypothetical protein [Helicobacter bizzozeronii]GMT38027.1 hypothetical protein NHP20013_00830 [Helicobacter bizzozeronii]
MRFLRLVFLALPLWGSPLKIASDLGNQQGFLDILQQAFKQDTKQEIQWVGIPKNLCTADALLVSRSVWLSLKLEGMPILQERLILLGNPSTWAKLQAKTPLALLKALQEPAISTHLKVMLNTLKTYRPDDLILMSQRLYLQQKTRANLPPILHQPLRMRYFWINPCHSDKGASFGKWLLSPQARPSIEGFRIDYQPIFTLIKHKHGH